MEGPGRSSGGPVLLLPTGCAFRAAPGCSVLLLPVGCVPPRCSVLPSVAVMCSRSLPAVPCPSPAHEAGTPGCSIPLPAVRCAPPRCSVLPVPMMCPRCVPEVPHPPPAHGMFTPRVPCPFPSHGMCTPCCSAPPLPMGCTPPRCSILLPVAMTCPHGSPLGPSPAPAMCPAVPWGVRVLPAVCRWLCPGDSCAGTAAVVALGTLGGL